MRQGGGDKGEAERAKGENKTPNNIDPNQVRLQRRTDSVGAMKSTLSPFFEEQNKNLTIYTH